MSGTDTLASLGQGRNVHSHVKKIASRTSRLTGMKMSKSQLMLLLWEELRQRKGKGIEV